MPAGTCVKHMASADSYFSNAGLDPKVQQDLRADGELGLSLPPLSAPDQHGLARVTVISSAEPMQMASFITQSRVSISPE